jgi:hypothetical protein
MRRYVRRRPFVAVACLAALVLVLVAAPVARADDTVCGVAGNPAPFILPPGVYDNIIVPKGGTCWILGDSATISIRGNVTAFQGSRLFMRQVGVGGNVKGLADSVVQISALPGRTEIGGNVVGEKTDYLELQFSGNIVRGDVHVTGRGRVPAADADVGVNICGLILPNGNIEVEKMTVANFGIYVSNAFCSALTFVNNGTVKVEDNHILGNAVLDVGEQIIANGNLHVFKNTGPGMKSVQFNSVQNGDIQCYENENPFVGGPNQGRAPKSVFVTMFPPVTAPNQCFGTSM